MVLAISLQVSVSKSVAKWGLKWAEVVEVGKLWEKHGYTAAALSHALHPIEDSFLCHVVGIAVHPP